MPQRILICLALAPLVLTTACDGDDPHAPAGAVGDLTATVWVAAGHDDTTGSSVYARVDELVDDALGFAFGEDGALTYRWPGFCVTPPLTYFDVDGVWQLEAPNHLLLAYPGQVDEDEVWEVVSLTAERLLLRRFAPRPPTPRERLAGTWTGTYTITFGTSDPVRALDEGKVTVVFAGAKFTVTPARPLVPPAADGYWTAGADALVLRDALAHTADYDWTLNVNGGFEWSEQDGVLRLRQEDVARDRRRTFELVRKPE